VTTYSERRAKSNQHRRKGEGIVKKHTRTP
jgi:hypothetical protein